jgi:hypothetical protein
MIKNITLILFNEMDTTGEIILNLVVTINQLKERFSHIEDVREESVIRFNLSFFKIEKHYKYNSDLIKIKNDLHFRRHLSMIEDEILLLVNNHQVAPSSNNTIIYLLNETIDNIEQHAEAKEIYMQYSFDVDLKLLEICIYDNGLGLKQRYSNSNFDEVKDDYDALNKAFNGQSVKEVDGGGLLVYVLHVNYFIKGLEFMEDDILFGVV